MAPARSIQCINRPPSSAPRGLASFGRTSSAISDCESRTGRAEGCSSVIFVFPLINSGAIFQNALSRLLHPRIQKALRHFLQTRIGMRLDPHRARAIELKNAVGRRTMVSLADVAQLNDAINWLRAAFITSPSQHAKADCIPLAFLRSPRAAVGITKIAKCLLHMLLGNLAFVAGSGAMPAPSSTERQPRRMRPVAAIQLFDRHEIRAGQRLCS